MLIPTRIYIASPDAGRLAAFFYLDAGFDVVGAENAGAQALPALFSLSPDLLLLDSALAGLDGLALLDLLRGRMAAPPRVLFLSRLAGAHWDALAREKGADHVLPWPQGNAALLEGAVACARLPLPALAQPMEKERLRIADGLLTRLHVPPSLKGRRYMRDAAACVACAPQLALSYRDRLYPFLAQRFSTTPQAVERAVRTAVEHTWLRGDLPAIQALFGLSVDAERGKPTNAEFLSMLAEHVRRETVRLLPDRANL